MKSADRSAPFAVITPEISPRANPAKQLSYKVRIDMQCKTHTHTHTHKLHYKCLIESK
eukprot:SAG31_NODE_43071_length_268_cov_1.733728_1_plen_57_part_10